MANPDRLTALDSTFLHLEDNSTAHMHVASVMVFEGTAPTPQELVDHIVSRLHLVPRYRQRLAYVPYGQGRPVWADDPHFNPRYHIRHTALPKPADDKALKQLAGRLFSQRLDRSKPLWEIWLVEKMAGERFALIAKTHHALVDGISGVDITTVLFDTSPDPVPTSRPPMPWTAKPLPGQAKLLGEALRERTTVPAEIVRGARRLLRAPRRAATQLVDGLTSIGATTIAGVKAPAPDSPFNVEIGPHRRYTFIDADLEQFKAIKASLGGTLNDVVLATVSLGLGRYLRREGFDTEGLELKAMVPVSVRADSDRGALGNQVAAMWAPLPVGVQNPAECLQQVTRSMEDLKASGQAVGAQVLTQPGRLRAADDPQPGGAPAGAPALLQPGRDERAGPAVPAVRARAAPARALPGRAAGPAPGARHRGDELRRAPRLRPARRLRRAARARDDRERHEVGDLLAGARRRSRAAGETPRRQTRLLGLGEESHGESRGEQQRRPFGRAQVRCALRWRAPPGRRMSRPSAPAWRAPSTRTRSGATGRSRIGPRDWSSCRS